MKVWTTIDKRNGRPDLGVATDTQIVPDDRPYIVIAEAEFERMKAMTDALLNHCDKDGGECRVCSVIVCPHKDPLHFHHDGCPTCSQEAEAQTALKDVTP